MPKPSLTAKKLSSLVAPLPSPKAAKPDSKAKPNFFTASRRTGISTSLGIQHNFNREIGNTPAFGVRADAYLPTGRGSEGVDFRLRGIASKSFGQYARLHLNVDLRVDNSPAAGGRRTQPGIILGYSQPLGYPTRFDRTLVAQVGYRVNPTRGASGLVNIGVGLRQQVTPKSVFDVGVTSDVSGGANRESFKLVAGYSTAF
jgi:hypothetical protein